MIDGWVAYDRVEPIRDEWEHTGTIASELREVVRMIAAAHGMKPLPDSTEPADYRPSVNREPKQPQEMSDEQLRRVMDSTMRM